MESSVESRSDCRRFVVCPTPRRPVTVNFVLDELSGSNAGSELLNSIITMDGHGFLRSSNQTGSSPRPFSGSPPCRVSNPLIQDARFRDVKDLPTPCRPVSPKPSPARSGSVASPSTSSRKGGCARVNFGNKPAARVEGFDCLDIDSRNCSIPGLA